MDDDWWFEDGKAYCPKCGDTLLVVATAYGFRMNCAECLVRWTRIRGESDWTPERLRLMGE